MGVVHWNKAAGTFLIFMVFTGLAPTRARADGFAWYDDPNSAFLAFSNSVSGNDLLFTIPVQNTGAAHDIALLILSSTCLTTLRHNPWPGIRPRTVGREP